MTALLLIYAVGVVGTALSFCRDEERGFWYRVEAMVSWPARVVVMTII